MLVNPKVSIVIPCPEVDSFTRESVEHCLSLDYPDFEILLLPDSEPDIDFPGMKVIPSGPVGPSEKRDLALEYASGEIIAFIDNDAYPREDWLREGIKHFKDDDIAAVGGPAVTPPSDGLLAQASGFVFSSFLGSGSLSFRYIPKAQRYVDDYPTCNLIIRKSVLQEMGGFSTFFWPGEDTKLCLEITHKLNKKIVYDPEVLVYHHRRNLFWPHLKQVWNYALHRGYFVKALPQTSRRFSYFIPSLFCLGLILGIAVSFLNPVLRIMFLSIVAVYLLLALIASLQSKCIRLIPLVFSGIILTHITYGIGFIKGLFTKEPTR